MKALLIMIIFIIVFYTFLVEQDGLINIMQYSASLKSFLVIFNSDYTIKIIT